MWPFKINVSLATGDHFEQWYGFIYKARITDPLYLLQWMLKPACEQIESVAWYLLWEYFHWLK